MKSHSFRGVGFICLMAVAGCSSSESPAANRAKITGSVSNAPMKARSAIARYASAPMTTDGSGDEQGLTILISDKENTCSSFHAQNSTNLTITIPSNDLTPGAYSITESASTASDGEESEVDFNTLDQSCNDELVDTATSGTVTLDDVVFNLVGRDDSVVSGTIDATFAGGRLTGDFDAIICPDAVPDPATPRAEASPADSACAP